MRTSLTALLLAAFLVTSLAVPFGPAGPAVAQEDTETDQSCETEIAHDSFLEDESKVEEFNDSGSVATIKRNTRVTIEETTSFYRLKAENPNSYCTHITVSVSEEILPPTNLGDVDSNNEVTTATWQDVLNFDDQKAHTKISFVAPPNSTVLFAPSKPTVLIPAWRDDRKNEAKGALATVKSYVSDEDTDLEKRKYTFSADDSPSVTIPLKNEDGNETKQITDWVAVYRTSESEPWRPVDKESDDPVFYQEIEDGDKVRFYFEDEDAEVEFRANPDLSDKAVWDYRSFKRSLYDLKSWSPLGMMAPVQPGGVPW